MDENILIASLIRYLTTYLYISEQKILIVRLMFFAL